MRLVLLDRRTEGAEEGASTLITLRPPTPTDAGEPWCQAVVHRPLWPKPTNSPETISSQVSGSGMGLAVMTMVPL